MHLPLRLALELGLKALLERGVVALRLRAAEVVSRALGEDRGIGGAVDPGPGTRRSRENAQHHRQRAHGAQQIFHRELPCPRMRPASRWRAGIVEPNIENANYGRFERERRVTVGLPRGAWPGAVGEPRRILSGSLVAEPTGRVVERSGSRRPREAGRRSRELRRPAPSSARRRPAAAPRTARRPPHSSSPFRRSCPYRRRSHSIQQA